MGEFCQNLEHSIQSVELPRAGFSGLPLILLNLQRGLGQELVPVHLKENLHSPGGLGGWGRDLPNCQKGAEGHRPAGA